MLERAIYCNVFLLFIMSIVLMVMAFKKKMKKERLKPIIVTYLVYTIISFLIYNCGIIEIGWDLLFLQPITIITIVINIISIFKTTTTSKKEKFNVAEYILFTIVPVLMIVIPFSYELYIINNCDYLIKYNYQNGIVISEDSYLAIINDRVKELTIQSNILGRESREVEVTRYEVIYKEEVVITTRDENHDEVTVEDENIKKIALEVREKGKRIKGAYIDYLKEENYAIITLLADEGYGSVVGEYLYSNNKYLKIDTPSGDIEQVIYYK